MTKKLMYVSTRNKKLEVPPLDTILTGLAPDGGLFVPTFVPQMNFMELVIEMERNGPDFYQLATEVLTSFFPDIPPDDMRGMVDYAYTHKFENCMRQVGDVVPVNHLFTYLGHSVYVAELSNGPTLAFKDIALQLLAPLTAYALKKKGQKKLNILAATSGDTGSASIHAFKGKTGINVFVLSPKDNMTEFQKAQMYSVLDENIHNLVIDGTFDDCQAIVKTLFGDAEFKAKHHLGAVNSINWARIAAQVVYYVWTVCDLVRREIVSEDVFTGKAPRILFVVPSGNFGNAYAGLVARQMGLPIDILAVSNENDFLYQFIKKGIYEPRPSDRIEKTTSPSMDIGRASNLERLINDLFDGNSGRVKAFMGSKKEKLALENIEKMQLLFGLHAACGRGADDVMGELFDYHEQLVDPHTAVAISGFMEFVVKNPDSIPPVVVVLETAQVAKFEEAFCNAHRNDGPPPLPRGFRSPLGFKQSYSPLPNDVGAVRDHITAVLSGKTPT